MGEVEIFAIRIKQIREKMELNQTDFAKFIEIKQQTLSGYERSIMKPPLDVARNIAEKCNVSIDWLCGLSEKESYSDNIETYGDAIRLLLKLEISLDICICSEYINSDIDGFNRLSTISFGNDKMKDFLFEWDKMKELHDKDTIDDDVYNLWIEKTLKKFDEFPVVGKGWEN